MFNIVFLFTRHVCREGYSYKGRVFTSLKIRASEDHPRPRGRGHGVKGPRHCIKGGPERALLVVKGRIRWRKGRVRQERAMERVHTDELRGQ